MIIIITLFYFSLATIILMVLWKLVSIRELRISLIEGLEKEFHGKIYEKVHELWHLFFVRQLAYIRAVIVVFLFTIVHETLRIAEVLGERLKVRHRKIFDLVKGKGVISKKGSASFFLSDVAKYKKSIIADKEHHHRR